MVKMAQNQPSSIRIVGANMQETAILSDTVEFNRDGDTEFQVEVAQCEYRQEPELPDNTIEIRDSAISSLVLSSENTKIDSRGAKASIKIRDVPDAMQHPEGDVPLSEQPTEPGGTNVMINTVVNSHDTKIDMSGCQIRTKSSGGRKIRRPVQEGKINISNAACLNLISHSVNTTINTSEMDVEIE